MLYCLPADSDNWTLYRLALGALNLAAAAYYPIALASQMLREIFFDDNPDERASTYDGLLEAAGWSPGDWRTLRAQLEDEIRHLIKVGWQVLGAPGPCPPVRFVGRRRTSQIERYGTCLEFGQPRDRIEIWSGIILYSLAAARHPLTGLIEPAPEAPTVASRPDLFRCCPRLSRAEPGLVLLHELAHAAARWEVSAPDPDGRDAPLFAMAERTNAAMAQQPDRYPPEKLLDPGDVQLVLRNGFRPLLLDSWRLARLSDFTGPDDQRALDATWPRPFAQLLDEALADAVAKQAAELVRPHLPSSWLWLDERGGPAYSDEVVRAYSGGAALLFEIFGPAFAPLSLLQAPDPLAALLDRISEQFGPARADEVRTDLLSPVLESPYDPEGGLHTLFEGWRARWLRS
jgi:hypothetical protein